MSADELKIDYNSLIPAPLPYGRIPCFEFVLLEDARPYSGNGTDTLEFDQIKAKLARAQCEREQQAFRAEMRGIALREILREVR